MADSFAACTTSWSGWERKDRRTDPRQLAAPDRRLTAAVVRLAAVSIEVVCQRRFQHGLMRDALIRPVLMRGDELAQPAGLSLVRRRLKVCT